jgi:hypothetical protein
MYSCPAPQRLPSFNQQQQPTHSTPISAFLSDYGETIKSKIKSLIILQTLSCKISKQKLNSLLLSLESSVVVMASPLRRSSRNTRRIDYYKLHHVGIANAMTPRSEDGDREVIYRHCHRRTTSKI